MKRFAAACALAGVLPLAMALPADAGGADDPPAELQELIVTGERAGPGLWHVYRGPAQLWIFGTVSPLPKDMTWRSKQLEAILDHTDQLLAAKPFEIGVARALWLIVTQRDLLMVGHGKKLKDVLPADLYARFAAQRSIYTKDAAKWEKFRPIIAAAFLQEDALHRVGLSTRLDLADEVRSLARKHHVRIEEFKFAGLRDVLDALRTLPPATENKCVAASLATIETGLPRLIDRARAWATGDVERIQGQPEPDEVAACRAAITVEAGSGDLLAQLKHIWLENMERHLRSGGVTLAVVNMDMLIEPGGFLDELRARGYAIDAP
ncbi:MAG TPA: TraB/GumN family protein [Steroidobacteraceae bacterium]|nr:TraB/GumN family protein [Steroidobacteraceae bacterium]